MNNNLFSLKDKKILITGGLGLIGRHFAKIVSKNNGCAILIDILEENRGKEEALKIGENVSYYFCDITSSKSIRNLISDLKKDFGLIDVLVNNAARNPKVEGEKHDIINYDFENFPETEWDLDISVNITGAFLITKNLYQLIRKNTGVILNISSDLGLIAPNQSLYSHLLDSKGKKFYKPVTYSVSKSAIIGFTRYLSTYKIENGIRCNALAPGGIEATNDKKFLSKIHDLIPLRRMAKLDDLDGVFIYLISSASSYMNGAIVSIDGGRTSW